MLPVRVCAYARVYARIRKFCASCCSNPSKPSKIKASSRNNFREQLRTRTSQITKRANEWKDKRLRPTDRVGQEN